MSHSSPALSSSNGSLGFLRKHYTVHNSGAVPYSQWHTPPVRRLDLEKVSRNVSHHPPPSVASSRVQWVSDPFSAREHTRNASVVFETTPAQLQTSVMSRRQPVTALELNAPENLPRPSRANSSSPCHRNQSILRRQVISRDPLMEFLSPETLVDSPFTQVPMPGHARFAATVADLHIPSRSDVRQRSVGRWPTSHDFFFQAAPTAPSPNEYGETPIEHVCLAPGSPPCSYTALDSDTPINPQPAELLFRAPPHVSQDELPRGYPPGFFSGGGSPQDERAMRFGYPHKHLNTVPSLSYGANATSHPDQSSRSLTPQLKMHTRFHDIQSPYSSVSMEGRTDWKSIAKPSASHLQQVNSQQAYSSWNNSLGVISAPRKNLQMNNIHESSKSRLRAGDRSQLSPTTFVSLVAHKESNGPTSQGRQVSRALPLSAIGRTHPFENVSRPVRRNNEMSGASSSHRSLDYSVVQKPRSHHNSRQCRLPALSSQTSIGSSGREAAPTTFSRTHENIHSMSLSKVKSHTQQCGNSYNEVVGESYRHARGEVSQKDKRQSKTRRRQPEDLSEGDKTSVEGLERHTASLIIGRNFSGATSEAHTAGTEGDRDVLHHRRKRQSNRRRSRNEKSGKTASSPSMRAPPSLEISVAEGSNSTEVTDPVLMQIQTAVSELATICKTLKEKQPSINAATTTSTTSTSWDDASILGDVAGTTTMQSNSQQTKISPRTLSELTEKMSKDITSQVLNSILHTLNKDKDTLQSEKDESTMKVGVTRTRASSWADAPMNLAKQRAKNSLEAKNRNDRCQGEKNVPTLPPECHTVSSIAPPDALSTLCGSRPDMHTYGGTQVLVPSWMMAPSMNVYPNAAGGMDMMNMFHPLTFATAPTFMACGSSVFPPGSPCINNTSLKNQCSNNPMPLSSSSTVHTHVGPQFNDCSEKASLPLDCLSSLSLKQPARASMSQPRYGTAPSSFREKESPMNERQSSRKSSLSTTSPACTKIQTSSNSGVKIASRVNVYEGARIQTLDSAKLMNRNADPFLETTQRLPHIKRINSGADRNSNRASVLHQNLCETNAPIKEILLNSDINTSDSSVTTPVSMPLPKQELLYTLKIDTFHGDNGDITGRHDSWAQTREVDVIQIHKEPEILILPEFLLPTEVDMIIKVANEKWTATPRPGVITDEITRMDAFGRIITSSYQALADCLIYVAAMSSDKSSCLGRVQRRLAASAQMKVSDIECMYALKYSPGAFLPYHVDGHRSKTAIIFLNDVKPGGGAIAFLKLGLQVQPQSGTALLWTNIRHSVEKGRQLDTRSIHCDRPHPTDEKIVLVCMFKDDSKVRGS